MGRSIDLYSYDYEKLINKVLEVCKTNDRETVEKVLLSCGNKIGDRYIILNQEFWEDYSCYYNVATALERIYKVDDVFGKVFCTFNNSETDKQELIQAMELNEVEEVLGFNLPPAGEEKDCINCECTRLEDNQEPCCKCVDYSEWTSDAWMHKKICFKNEVYNE